MAVYTHHTELTADEAERINKYMSDPEASEGTINYYIGRVQEGTFDPRTDTRLTDKTFKRLVDGTEGRTISVKESSTYLGDGDRDYYGIAIVANDDGTYRTVYCGKGGWYNVDLLGAEVDAPQEVIDAYHAKVAADIEARKRTYYNTYTAYEVEAGKEAYVTRGRKQKGRSGRIFWHGMGRFGFSIGIEDAKGDRFFTAAQNVDVIADYSEAWGE